MFNIGEQPWTLIGIAVIVFFVILTIRSVFPEKRRLWQWLIPILIIAGAFGIDKVIKTDREQIELVIDTGIKALEQENFNLAESLISDDYSDSLHRSKEQLISHINRELPRNVVEKSKKTNSLITISGNKAKVNLFMLITFNQDSNVNQIYSISFIQIKADLTLKKQNERWLLDSIEVRTVNKQPLTWNQIR